MISFYWFEIDFDWWAIIYNLSRAEVLAEDEDAGVWNTEMRTLESGTQDLAHDEQCSDWKTEKFLYNFCSSISCGFVMSLFELSEGVMFYLHGICISKSLEVLSVCSSFTQFYSPIKSNKSMIKHAWFYVTRPCNFWQNVTVRCCLYFHGWEWGVSQRGDIVNQPLITGFYFSLLGPRLLVTDSRYSTGVTQDGVTSQRAAPHSASSPQSVTWLPAIILVALQWSWRSELGGFAAPRMISLLQLCGEEVCRSFKMEKPLNISPRVKPDVCWCGNVTWERN